MTNIGLNKGGLTKLGLTKIGLTKSGLSYEKSQSIAIQYLKDELSPAAEAEFECYLLDNPALIEELQLDDLMISYLREEERKALSLSQKLIIKPFAWLTLSGGLLAAFFMGIMVSQFFWQVGGGGEMLSNTLSSTLSNTLSSTKVIYSGATRGSGGVQSVSLGDTENFVIALPSGTLEEQNYMVTVQTKGNAEETVFKTAQLRSDSEGFIYVMLNRKQLQSGRVELILQAENNQTGREVYSILATP